MLTRPSPRLSVTILLTIVAGLLAALAGILGNIAASSLPTALTPYLWLSWPALVVIVLLGIGISIWQGRREAKAAALSAATQQQLPPPAAPAALPVPGASPATGPVSSPAQPGTDVYHSCVVSYATDDQPFAEKLHADLVQAGVSCWFAPQDFRQGDKLRDEIFAAIRNHEKLLLILSAHAIESQWVEEEVEAALDWEHRHPGTYLLFPARLDEQVFQTEKAWAVTVRQRFIGDFQRWDDDTVYQRAFQRLLRDLKR